MVQVADALAAFYMRRSELTYNRSMHTPDERRHHANWCQQEGAKLAARLDDRMVSLATSAINLNMRDKEFALSLMRGFADKGYLSAKQWEWVGKLATRATNLVAA